MTCQHVLFCQNYPRYQRFSFLTRAAGCFGVGPQADKNRLTAESKCGDAGNRASKVIGYLAPRVLRKEHVLKPSLD